MTSIDNVNTANKNMDENKDNTELIKINNTIQSIEDDDIGNDIDGDNTNNAANHKPTFADKVKLKERPKSWAEQASPLPFSDNSEILDVCFGNDNENIQHNKDNQKSEIQESENQDQSDYEDNYEDNYPITPFQQQLLDRIESLENIQDILIENYDEQKKINDSLLEKNNKNYYLRINIFIHAINDNNENTIRFISKKIPLHSENYLIATFCDINQKTGNIKYDDKKLIDFLKKIESQKNINEKHVSYWINKAINDNVAVNLDITSVEIITNNNHIKSTLVHIFNEFKEKFKYQQALKEKIEEGKNKSKQHKPRFYLNSKNLDLDNEFKELKSESNVDNHFNSQVSNNNSKHDTNKRFYDNNRQEYGKLSKEQQSEIMNIRAERDCWSFLSTGTCEFGDKCHYKHDEEKRLRKQNKNKNYNNNNNNNNNYSF